MSELVGQTLGQYQIAAVLGEGGMATVYRAHQASIKRDVAIKVIESKLARNPEFVTRFEREAQTVASLDHPHILKVFDFGQQGDLIYLVMELKTGGTLNKQLSSNPLPLETIAALLTQIASALDYAHGRGIIHRDLKPQNVLLDEQGNAFLTDFGIAKLIQPDYTSLTQTGAAMGTPAYMSPEQWQGHTLDARSDLYSLGIMLYEMLTGRVPFHADTPASMMFAHLQQNPPPLRDLRPTLPHHLDSVIEKILAKSPDARFQTARALADAFRDAVNGKPFALSEKLATPPMSESVPSIHILTTRRGISLPLVIAGALIAILAIGGLVLTLQRNDGSTPTNPVSNVTATPATQVAAALSTTSEPSATPTPIPASPTQSATSVPTDTLTASPTITASYTPSQRPTATIMLDIVQIVASLDAQATAAVRATNLAATTTAITGATLTATSRTQTPTATLTPTPNITASIEAFLAQRAALTGTAQAYLDATETATSWTHTPTATLTFTLTHTPTNTLTYTPTATSTHTSTTTPTQTDLPTSTPTRRPATATRTSIPTRVPTTASQGITLVNENAAIGPGTGYQWKITSPTAYLSIKVTFTAATDSCPIQIAVVDANTNLIVRSTFITQGVRTYTFQPALPAKGDYWVVIGGNDRRSSTVGCNGTESYSFRATIRAITSRS